MNKQDPDIFSNNLDQIMRIFSLKRNSVFLTKNWIITWKILLMFHHISVKNTEIVEICITLNLFDDMIMLYVVYVASKIMLK